MRGEKGKSETIHTVYLLWLPKIVVSLYSILFLCQIFLTRISPSLLYAYIREIRTLTISALVPG